MTGAHYTLEIDDRLRQLPPEAMMPWLLGFGDVQRADAMDVVIGNLRVVVRIDIPPPDGSWYKVVIADRIRKLPPEWVPWWVTGVADAHDDRQRLSVVDEHVPADTRRMHMLQVGDAAGWFEYRYPPTGEASPK